VSYLDNIANRKAVAFYRRHGVARIDPKTLRAADVADCALMTSKYCIRAQLDICPKMSGQIDNLAGPLTMSDNTGEYVLNFNCAQCEMTVRKKN
jgi:putative protease